MSATRILVVEDERIVATAIKNELEQFGYTVSGIASSAPEAVSKAVQGQPDLVLMDIHLEGEQDGINAAREIYSTYRIPVIYLTAFADSDILARAAETEAFGYLLKPYEERELQTTIEMALTKHKAEQRREENRRWLAAILDGIDDAVFATDPDNRIQYMNLAGEAMTGWRMEDIAKEPFAAVCNLTEENGRIMLEDLADKAICESRTVELPVTSRLATRDGRETPIEGVLSPIHDFQGEFLGMAVKLRDLRRRLKLEEVRRETIDRRRLSPQAKASGRRISSRQNDDNAGMPKEQARAKSSAKRPTILLADADSSDRDVGRQVLERQGYQVVLAADDNEAIFAFQKAAEQIDLVIVDLNMPRLNTYSLMERLLEIDPEVPILLSSSYFSEDLIEDEGHTRGVINKPYNYVEFVEMVRRALVKDSEQTLR